MCLNLFEKKNRRKVKIIVSYKFPCEIRREKKEKF